MDALRCQRQAQGRMRRRANGVAVLAVDGRDSGGGDGSGGAASAAAPDAAAVQRSHSVRSRADKEDSNFG